MHRKATSLPVFMYAVFLLRDTEARPPRITASMAIFPVKVPIGVGVTLRLIMRKRLLCKIQI